MTGIYMNEINDPCKYLPKEALWQGQVFRLYIEEVKNKKIQLTYEYEPIRDDLFLISVTNDDLEKASQNMIKHLVKAGIIFNSI